MSYSERYRISIERLSNAFQVEVPDWDEIKKREAKNKGKGMDMPCYVGDCTKKYAAKNLNEVMRFVKEALGQIPDAEYDAAFKEAAGKK